MSDSNFFDAGYLEEELEARKIRERPLPVPLRELAEPTVLEEGSLSSDSGCTQAEVQNARRKLLTFAPSHEAILYNSYVCIHSEIIRLTERSALLGLEPRQTQQFKSMINAFTQLVELERKERSHSDLAELSDDELEGLMKTAMNQRNAMNESDQGEIDGSDPYSDDE